MLMKPLRWVLKNLSTLLLAFLMALVVWVSAVLSADPNEKHALSRPIPIQIIGKDPGLKIIGTYASEVDLTLIAPQTLWERLEKERDTIQAWVDLASLGEGVHTVPVQVQINIGLARLVQQEPEEITLTLETLVSQDWNVNLVVNGEPPLGYQAGTPKMEPSQVTLSGPVSLASRVKEIRAFIDITGITETNTRTVTLTPLDADGRLVSGITLSQNAVAVTQPVNLLGGYRNVIVKVVTVGNVTSGYRLTNYFVNPSSVIVFSADPNQVNALPGYIETKPLDLTNTEDDFETLLELNLPDGVVAVSDSKVLVQVSIAAIESSLSISLPLEVTGLGPGLKADVSPNTVDMILSGPVPVLNALKPNDIRVKVDLAGFAVGTYQVLPVVDFLPERVQKLSILPSTVEVIITILPTPTPTLTPSGTPKPTLTPRP